MTLEQIAGWCAPWNHAFSHSKVIAGSVTGVHIIALMFGGGLAISADRLTLRVAANDDAGRARQLRDVRAVHRPVIIALAVLFASGVLLALADVETFFPSPFFWIKLSLVSLLVINGSFLALTERRLNGSAESSVVAASGWNRMRVFSYMSVILWTATAVAGIVLSNVS